MAKKYWITQTGEEIYYKDLEDDHLLNILKYIKRQADEGMLISGGFDEDGMPYGDFAYGDEVLVDQDYKGLMREAKKRGLVISSYQNQNEKQKKQSKEFEEEVRRRKLINQLDKRVAYAEGKDVDVDYSPSDDV